MTITVQERSGTIVVDMRPKSDTYGQWKSYELKQDNNMILFVPKGFAHGFLTLTDMAIVNYKVDSYYNKKSDSGIHYNDPTLGINWDISERGPKIPIPNSADIINSRPGSIIVNGSASVGNNDDFTTISLVEEISIQSNFIINLPNGES